jgi:hypothetical protein
MGIGQMELPPSMQVLLLSERQNEFTQEINAIFDIGDSLLAVHSPYPPHA